MRHVYLDNNATTPLDEHVKRYLEENWDVFGNASSMHGFGRKARAKIEESRGNVAALICARAEEIVFTSGGSESNNTVFMTLLSHKLFKNKKEIITSQIEHPSVLETARFMETLGFIVHYVPVDRTGKIDTEFLRSRVSDKTALVSIMYANNEIGTLQDIKGIAEIAHAHGAYVHTDAVQAVGKVPVDVRNIGVDYLSLSGHKIYGPKGVGALYIKKGSPIVPFIHGGHQEEGVRAGTYNNIGIFGLGIAASRALQSLSEQSMRLQNLRNRLRDGIVKRIGDIHINGHPTDNLPNTLNVSFPGAEGESILLYLDLEGIAVSTGSACASGSLDPSHVLIACGLGPELAHGSIRFSLGKDTTAEDIDYVLDTLPGIIKKIRSMSTLQGGTL